MFDLSFYRGKRVLITGHTGFKGSWLSRILIDAGASVTGYALEPPTDPGLFSLCRLEEEMDSVTGDIRDFDHLLHPFKRVKPEIVFHLAAQPLVRESYIHPRETYETNVMGTVNLLECARICGCVKSLLNVTTDKVYDNKEWEWGYRETDPLDGYDPYSNSKSCSELVTHSYQKSFFSGTGTAISTARAGNVIGGGDFADNRIIPDCFRAAAAGETVYLRNPYSVRPYQHVLEPLFVYLAIAAGAAKEPEKAGYYNVGPDEGDCVTTGELTALFARFWGEGFRYETRSDNGPHEAGFLKLDSSRVKKVFGWKPVWSVSEAVRQSVEWYKAYALLAGSDECAGRMNGLMRNQIKEFIKKSGDNYV